MAKGARSNPLVGKKCMPTERMPMGKGKMSSEHGLTKNTSPTKGMHHAEGRIGSDTRHFKNTLTTEAGKK